jgi:hypothetical protein
MTKLSFLTPFQAVWTSKVIAKVLELPSIELMKEDIRKSMERYGKNLQIKKKHEPFYFITSENQ